jgi:hypothetical protein
VTVKSVAPINDGQWHLVVCTRDSATGRIEVYVDGRLEAGGTASVGVKNASPRLTIGAIATLSPGQFFKGVIDDVRLYDRVLLPGNIADLIAAASSLYDTVTCHVSTGVDDAKSMKWDLFSILDEPALGVGQYMAGMRFRNVKIPAGARIKSAVLKIRSYTDGLTGNVDGILRAEAADNPADFSGFGRAPSKVPKTSASQVWKLASDAPWMANTWYDSPDIRTVIQEVVDRPGWSAGNAVVVVFSSNTDTGSDRQFWSYDGDPDSAAKLVITYRPK